MQEANLEYQVGRHQISGAEVTKEVKQLCCCGAPRVDEICLSYHKVLDVVGLFWFTSPQHCVDIEGNAGVVYKGGILGVCLTSPQVF